MVEVMAIKAAFFGLEVNWQKTKCICVHVSHATTSQIVESCPLTELNGGLSRLHSVDEDTVSRLTSYGSWQAYEKKKQSSLYQLFSLSSVYSHDLTVLSETANTNSFRAHVNPMLPLWYDTEGFNIALDTSRVISEMIFPANHLTGAKTSLPNQSPGCY